MGVEPAREFSRSQLVHVAEEDQVIALQVGVLHVPQLVLIDDLGPEGKLLDFGALEKGLRASRRYSVARK